MTILAHFNFLDCIKILSFCFFRWIMKMTQNYFLLVPISVVFHSVLLKDSFIVDNDISLPAPLSIFTRSSTFVFLSFFDAHFSTKQVCHWDSESISSPSTLFNINNVFISLYIDWTNECAPSDIRNSIHKVNQNYEGLYIPYFRTINRYYFLMFWTTFNLVRFINRFL